MSMSGSRRSQKGRVHAQCKEIELEFSEMGMDVAETRAKKCGGNREGQRAVEYRPRGGETTDLAGTCGGTAPMGKAGRSRVFTRALERDAAEVPGRDKRV